MKTQLMVINIAGTIYAVGASAAAIFRYGDPFWCTMSAVASIFVLAVGNLAFRKV